MYGSQFKNDSAVLGGRLVRRGVGRARSPTRHTPNTGLLHALLLFTTHTHSTRSAHMDVRTVGPPQVLSEVEISFTSTGAAIAWTEAWLTQPAMPTAFEQARGGALGAGGGRVGFAGGGLF